MENQDAFAKRMKLIETKVELLLKEISECRNSDRLLIFEYWNRFDNANLKMPTHKITSSETIRRVRQKIQNRGDYPETDPEVKKRRDAHRRKMRKYASEDK